MPPSIKLILFDFGNVISKPQNSDRMDRISRLTRLERNDLDRLYRKYRSDYDRGWINGPEYWNQILKHSSVNPDTNLLNELTKEDILSWMEFDIRMIDWAKTLKNNGFQIAVLSNMPSDELDYFRKHFDWIDIFDYTFFSCELKMLKPEPEIYKHALEQMGIAANQILFIDDLEENVIASRELGINSYLYRSFEELIDYFGKEIIDDRYVR